MFLDNFFNDDLFGFNESDSTNEFLTNKKNIKNESGVDKNGNKWNRSSYTSPDGSFYCSSFTSAYNFNGTKKYNPNNTKENSNNKDIKNLLLCKKQELENLVKKEEYEKAIKIRDDIKKIEKNFDKLNILLEQKEKAIKEENFEEAIKINKEINSLK